MQRNRRDQSGHSEIHLGTVGDDLGNRFCQGTQSESEAKAKQKQNEGTAQAQSTSKAEATHGKAKGIAKAKPGSENGTAFWAILAQIGPSWAILRPSWAILGPPWAYSGPPGKQELFRKLCPDLLVPRARRLGPFWSLFLGIGPFFDIQDGRAVVTARTVDMTDI